MGDPNNITNQTFTKAAEAEKQSVYEAKLKTLELLQQELNNQSK
jgi:hypothetical protein